MNKYIAQFTEEFLQEARLVSATIDWEGDNDNLVLQGKGNKAGPAHPVYGLKFPGKSAGSNNNMWGKFGKDNPNYGRKNTEETKAKMSKSAMGNTSALGAIRSDETKAKISKAKKIYWLKWKMKKLYKEAEIVRKSLV